MTWNQGDDQERENNGEAPTPSWSTDGWKQPDQNQADSGSHPDGDSSNEGQSGDQPSAGGWQQDAPQANFGPPPTQQNSGWQAPDQGQWQQQPNFGPPQGQAPQGQPPQNTGWQPPVDQANQWQGSQPDFGAPQEQSPQDQAPQGQAPQEQAPQSSGWQPPQEQAPQASGWQPPAEQPNQWQGEQPNFGAPQDNTPAPGGYQSNAADQPEQANQPEPEWTGGYSSFNAAHDATDDEQQSAGDSYSAPEQSAPDQAAPEQFSTPEQSATEQAVPEQQTPANSDWDSYGPATELLDTAATDAQPADLNQDAGSTEATQAQPTKQERPQNDHPTSAFGTWPSSPAENADNQPADSQPTESFGESAFSEPSQNQPASGQGTDGQSNDDGAGFGWGTAAAAGAAGAAGAGAWAAANQPWQQNEPGEPSSENQWGQQGETPQGENQWGQAASASQGDAPQAGNQWGQPENQWGQQDQQFQGQQDQQFQGQDAPTAAWPQAQQGDQGPVFGAPPAAFPGDQNMPFDNAQQGAGGPGGPGGPGGEGPGGPGGPGGFVPANAEGDNRKKPWYKKPLFIILAAVIAVIVIGGAIGGVMLFNHFKNVERGDNLAATFNNQLEAYNSTWNEENLAQVSAVNLTDPISAANRIWYDLNTENREALDQACTDLQPATDKLGELADTTVPELPQEDAAEASDAYKQAQEDADAVASQRESADEFLSGSETALGEMNEFCQNYGAYADLYDTFEENVAGVMEDAYSVPNGDRIETSDGAVYYLCESADGCADLYNSDTREQFAAAMETTYVGYYQGLADLYADQCFMSAFADTCAVGATEYQKAADAYQAIVDHLRTTEPTVEVGEVLYPELDSLGSAASDAETAADTAVLTEWQKVEPSAYSMATTGTSLGTLFSDKVATIQELATSALGS